MGIDTILSDREKTHGAFSDHARITQQLKFDMHKETGWNRTNNEAREALEMIAHKIGRILAGDPNVADHWNDIAGYATLVAKKCSK